jgi:hypothetical protein
MNPTACALIGLASWAIILTFALTAVRLVAIRGGKELNTFDSTGKDMTGLSFRVTRAHGNMIENLAIPASFLLYALATDQTTVTNGLASIVLWTRLGQSLVHLISTSKPMVLLRANLFGVQLIICLFWAWKFCST